MAYCVKCGNLLNDNAKFCVKCGNPIENSDNNGMLTVKWDGQWMLIDDKIRIDINGKRIGAYSFKKPFEVSIPISSIKIVIDINLSLRKYKRELTLNPSENYFFYLIYSRITGGFDFMLCDENGNQLLEL